MKHNPAGQAILILGLSSGFLVYGQEGRSLRSPASDVDPAMAAGSRQELEERSRTMAARNPVTPSPYGGARAANAVRVLDFTPQGLEVTPKTAAGRAWKYAFRGLSQEGTAPTKQASAAYPASDGREVTYSRGSKVVERYRATDHGFEQSFTIEQGAVPAGQDLVLAGAVETGLQAGELREMSRAGLVFYDAGSPVLHYGPARAVDANGSLVEAEVRWDDGTVSTVVDSGWLEDAAYPVTVETKAFVIDFGKIFPQNKEDGLVWRLQMRIVVADVSNAGTDDDVSVMLNGSNITWLDYARNDFERNSAFTYDLNVPGITKVADIQQIRISKTGSDGLCLRLFSLYVNGRNIYTLDFGAAGRWLDNDGYDHRTYTVGASTLRSNSYWKSYELQLPPMTIPAAEIVSRIESMVGHELHSRSKLYWGFLHGQAVELTYVNSRTIHVNLDLAYEVPLYPDAEVDVRFDLTFSCNNGVIGLTTSNMKYTVDWAWYENLLLPLTELAEWAIPKFFGSSLKNISYTADTGTSACADFYVRSDASIYLWGI